MNNINSNVLCFVTLRSYRNKFYNILPAVHILASENVFELMCICAESRVAAKSKFKCCQD